MENPGSFHSIFILVQTLPTDRYECPMHPLPQLLARGCQRHLHPNPRHNGKTESFLFTDPFPCLFHRKTLFHFHFRQFRSIPFCFRIFTQFPFFLGKSRQFPLHFHPSSNPSHFRGRSLGDTTRRLHHAPHRHGKNRKFHIQGSVSVDVPPENAVPFQFPFHKFCLGFRIFTLFPFFRGKSRKFPLHFHPSSNPSHLPQ